MRLQKIRNPCVLDACEFRSTLHHFVTGLHKNLSSWKSLEDPAPGQFSQWIMLRLFLNQSGFIQHFARTTQFKDNIAQRRHLSDKKRAIIIVSGVVSAMGVLVLGWVIFMFKRKLSIQGRTNNSRDINDNIEAWRLWKDERAVELIDQLLDYSSTLSEILRCIHIGLLCVQHRPEDRPNMSTVALMLGGEGSLPQPRQPGFFAERNLTEPEITINEITISLLEPR
ncbi:hypothetical protein Dsin_022757 [Dipteronia sinensis]|uniref:S-locus receptor kinase C-terminal domain-containing protein n=1 Tax=Dipteronia sinensis TaxID=43782 RepID=A0AAE0A317_9ROSI|nr:hypothetical protein Dsin_022757 [Dipteronia sinensis]